MSMQAKERSRVRRATVALAAAGALALAAAGAAAGSEPVIVGGSPAAIEDFPATVIFNVDGAQHCAGTLIAPDKVLTAAHCTDGVPASSMEIIGGRTEFGDTTTGEQAGVSAVWQNPGFDTAGMRHDDSVLTLDEALPYRPATPVQSADDPAYRAGAEATVVGWGTTSEGGAVSDVLLKVTVPVVDNETCAADYTASGAGYDKASMFCAGVPEGGKDSCQGDSGGPAYVDGKLAGIVSWGEGCGRKGFPGVYTNVGNDYADIAAHLGPAS
jgi:trypsin